MNNPLRERINGYGTYFRFITPVALGLALWVLTIIWGEIGEVQEDFKAISHNMLYKCDYAEDLEVTRSSLNRLDDRLRDVEKRRR